MSNPSKSNVPDEFILIPIRDNDEVIFVIEYSPAFEENVILLPNGIIGEGIFSIDLINHELVKKTGFRSKNITKIGEIQPWPHIESKTLIFLCRNLVGVTLEGDSTLDTKQLFVPLAKIDTLIEENKLQDAPSIAALYMAESFEEHKQ